MDIHTYHTSCTHVGIHSSRFRTTTCPWSQPWSQTFHWQQQETRSGMGSSSRCSTMMDIHTYHTSCTHVGIHSSRFRTTTCPWSQPWSQTFHWQQQESGKDSPPPAHSTMMDIRTSCHTWCTDVGSVGTTIWSWLQLWTCQWQPQETGHCLQLGMDSSSHNTMQGNQSRDHTSCIPVGSHTTSYPWPQLGTMAANQP